MPGSGLQQVLVAELERGLDCHVEGGIHHRAGEHDNLGHFYTMRLILQHFKHTFNVLFQHFNNHLADSHTLSLHSP